jgi:hypothetical protein
VKKNNDAANKKVKPPKERVFQEWLEESDLIAAGGKEWYAHRRQILPHDGRKPKREARP